MLTYRTPSPTLHISYFNLFIPMLFLIKQCRDAAVLYSTVLCRTVLCRTVLCHCSVLAQYCTVSLCRN